MHQQPITPNLRNLAAACISVMLLLSTLLPPVATHAGLFSKSSDDIWVVMAQNFKLKDHSKHPLVKQQIAFYTKQPHLLNQIAQQAEPYLHMILTEIEKRDLPHEFMLLPIMESAYDPTANSHAGASGLWQFMPRTAKSFGMDRNWWYDGRNDVYASTQGALTYLTYLVKFFDGDWLLAAAAYDSGEGTVQKAIRRNKKAGKKTDYWSLTLPKETRIYVPRFFALATIFSNPSKYGIELNPVPNKPYLKRMDLGQQMALPKIAELANIDLETLKEYNSAYKRLVTAPKGPHTVILPVSNANMLEKKLAKLTKDDHRSWVKYITTQGDNLHNVAQYHDAEPSLIRKVNQLAKSVTLKAGQTLVVPKPITQKAARTKPFGEQKMIYTIANNDSLWTISKHFQVKLSQLKQWNPELKGDKLFRGEQLTLWISTKDASTTDKANNTKTPTYTVRSGDSLSVIAHRYNTTIDNLQTVNDLTTNTLQIGQTLRLPIV